MPVMRSARGAALLALVAVRLAPGAACARAALLADWRAAALRS